MPRASYAISILPARPGAEKGGLPGSADVGLIVEIADSSLARDRGEKRDVYGRAGVPAYWIVNLAARQVEAHTLPVGGTYPPATIFAEDQEIKLALGGRTFGRIAVADLLPQRS